MPEHIQKQVKAQLEARKKLERADNQFRFRWHSKATEIIKEQLEKRKAKNLHGGNDWKVRFYQDKLDMKSNLLDKLRKMI